MLNNNADSLFFIGPVEVEITEPDELELIIGKLIFSFVTQSFTWEVLLLPTCACM